MRFTFVFFEFCKFDIIVAGILKVQVIRFDVSFEVVMVVVAMVALHIVENI